MVAQLAPPSAGALPSNGKAGLPTQVRSSTSSKRGTGRPPWADPP